MGSIQGKMTVVVINDEVINHNNMIFEYPTHKPPIQMMLYHIAVYINFYWWTSFPTEQCPTCPKLKVCLVDKENWGQSISEWEFIGELHLTK